MRGIKNLGTIEEVNERIIVNLFCYEGLYIRQCRPKYSLHELTDSVFDFYSYWARC